MTRATDLKGILDELAVHFGDEITLYKHQETTDADDFWQEEGTWENEGTTYEVVVEDEPSEETLERPGFADNAEAAIWIREDVAEEGDKVEMHGKEWIVLSTNNFYVSGKLQRQIIGVRSSAA